MFNMHGQVRVTLINNDFNKLVELVNIESKKENEDKNGYKKFFNKLMTYSFIKDDKVTINLYPSEARMMINVLRKNLNPIVITNDWMKELSLKKEQYKRNKEGDNNA